MNTTYVELKDDSIIEGSHKVHLYLT